MLQWFPEQRPTRERGFFAPRFIILRGSYYDLACVWLAPVALFAIGLFLGPLFRACSQ